MTAWHRVADTIEVEPGVVYRMEAYVRSEQPVDLVFIGPGSKPRRGLRRRRFRRPTCPLCLMVSWSWIAMRCEFCQATAQDLGRAGIEVPNGWVVARLEKRAA